MTARRRFRRNVELTPGFEILSYPYVRPPNFGGIYLAIFVLRDIRPSIRPLVEDLDATLRVPQQVQLLGRPQCLQGAEKERKKVN